ncbi:MAG: hypothetical protein R8G60_10835 [Roseovarius pacificus]|nr:hypothetical protein [Roseovarius pacificus]
MDDKTAYQEKMNAKLDEWKADIDKLQAKARQAQADAQIEYKDQIDELKKRRDRMEKELEQVQSASAEAWKDFKDGADKAWDAMSDAMKNSLEPLRLTRKRDMRAPSQGAHA